MKYETEITQSNMSLVLKVEELHQDIHDTSFCKGFFGFKKNFNPLNAIGNFSCQKNTPRKISIVLLLLVIFL